MTTINKDFFKNLTPKKVFYLFFSVFILFAYGFALIESIGALNLKGLNGFTRMVGTDSSPHALTVLIISTFALIITFQPSINPRRSIITVVGLGALHEGFFNVVYLIVYGRTYINQILDFSIITYTGFFKWISIFAVCGALVYIWLKTYPSPRWDIKRNKYYLGAFFWWCGIMVLWGIVGMPISLNAFNSNDINYFNPYVNLWEIAEWGIFLSLFGYAYFKGLNKDDKFKEVHDPRNKQKST